MSEKNFNTGEWNIGRYNTGRLRKEDNRSTTEFRPVHFLQEHWNQSRGGIKSGMIDKKYLTN